MAETEQTEKTKTEETGDKRTLSSKDLLSRLADAGEEAIQRLSDVPGGERLLNAANSMRNSIDDLSKRVRGLEKLETRIVELERRVDELSGTQTAAEPAKAPASEPAAGPPGPPSDAPLG